MVKSRSMNAHKPEKQKSSIFNTADLNTALQSSMLVDRHALRRKMRDVADLQKLADNRAVAAGRATDLSDK